MTGRDQMIKKKKINSQDMAIICICLENPPSQYKPDHMKCVEWKK